jgi:predicted Rossmann-fold nucleotide-binding protein
VLQGGTGTLLELALVWELINKKILSVKPIVSHSTMWKEIAEIIDRQLRLEKRVTGLVRNFTGVDEIADYLAEELNG